MTTTMEQALRATGMQLPTRLELAWRYVKDHPRTTAKTVTQALKWPQSNGAMLSSLERRGLVKGEWVDMRIMTKRGVKLQRVKHYIALGAVYEHRLEEGPLTSRKNPRKLPPPPIPQLDPQPSPTACPIQMFEPELPSPAECATMIEKVRAEKLLEVTAKEWTPKPTFEDEVNQLVDGMSVKLAFAVYRKLADMFQH